MANDIAYIEQSMSNISIEDSNKNEIINSYRIYNCKGKVVSPADLNNSTSKIIMRNVEKQLPIQEGIKLLHEELEYNKNQCVYCGKEPEKLSIDEIIPTTDDETPGRYNTLNCVNSCKDCNMSKNNKKGLEFEFWLKYGSKTQTIEKMKCNEIKDIIKNNNLNININQRGGDLRTELYRYMVSNKDIKINLSNKYNKSKVPLDKQQIIIDFINKNKIYLCTTDPKIIKKLKEIKEKNKQFLYNIIQECNKPINLKI